MKPPLLNQLNKGLFAFLNFSGATLNIIKASAKASFRFVEEYGVAEFERGEKNAFLTLKNLFWGIFAKNPH